MNKDELKAKAETLKERAKEALGSLTGGKDKEGGGLFDRVRGAVREKLGKDKPQASRDVSHTDDDE